MPDQRAPTLDKDPGRLLRLYKEAGVIPDIYNSWDELEADFASRIADGVSEKQARIDMGVDYRNIDGQPLLSKNQASDGSIRYLNKRAIRTDFNPSIKNTLTQSAGEQAVADRIKTIQRDWKVHTAQEAQALGRETGKQFHRGHVTSALEGGGLSQENMYPEHGMRNVLHGSAPRLPANVIDNNAIAKTDLEAYYNAVLDREGLGIARPNNALMIAADETMVDPTGPKTYIRNNEAGRAPETIEMTQNRLNQLEAQGVSRQAIDNWSRNQSATLSRGNAVQQSGPVRTVRPAVNKPVKVIEPGKIRPTVRRVPTGSAPAVVNKTSTVKPVAKPAAQTAKAAAGVSQGRRRGAAPPAQSARRFDPRNPGSASMQIRALQNAAPDVLQIHPGSSLPSQSLIRGI